MKKWYTYNRGGLMKIHRSYGFTLIEVITVVIILAILASFALPTYYNYIEYNRAQTAKNNLLAIATAQEKF